MRKVKDMMVGKRDTENILDSERALGEKRTDIDNISRLSAVIRSNPQLLWISFVITKV